MRSWTQVLVSGVAGVIVLVAGTWSWRHAASPAVPQEPVAAIVEGYSSLRPSLAGHHRIGFLATATDPPSVFQAAQFALAPAILETVLTGVTIAVTPPHAPERIDEDDRLAAFSLVSVNAQGIRVYRRR